MNRLTIILFAVVICFPGAAQELFGGPHLVSTQVEGATSLHAGDLDRDGDIDVVSAGEVADTVRWHENLGGTGQTWQDHAITSEQSEPRCVRTTDIDLDGDLDVFVASYGDDAIAWYENSRGDGSEWTRHDISVGQANGVSHIQIVDLDGDLDRDVLAASELDDTVSWFENQDIAQNFWRRRVISNDAAGARSVQAANLDGDGDFDVVVAAHIGDSVIWYENLDDATEWNAHNVAGIEWAERTGSVHAGDLDGDYDTDLVFTSHLQDSVVWAENMDGTGLTWNLEVLPGAADGVNTAIATDIDLDGDSDVVAVYVDSASWYANALDDTGAWTAQAIADSLSQGEDVFTADIDGDGDPDVLTASFSDNSIAWHENYLLAGRISGVIRSEASGLPITCATVVARPSEGGTLFTGTADLQGRYDIVGLPSDEYSVSVYAAGYETREETVELGWLEERRLSFVVSGSGSGASIQGTVTDARSGYPLAGVWVLAERGSESRDTFTCSSGLYEITGLAKQSGDVTLTFVAEGYETDVVIATPGGDPADVALTPKFTLQGDLAGTVVAVDGGNPIGNVQISASKPGSLGVSTMTMSSGLYLITGLDMGIYRVHASAQDYAPLTKLVTIYDAAPHEADFSLEAVAGAEGEGEGEGEDPSLGVITGTVTSTSGRHLSGVTIRVTGPESMTAQSSGGGTYRIANLTPGEYQVEAIAANYAFLNSPREVTVLMSTAVTEDFVGRDTRPQLCTGRPNRDFALQFGLMDLGTIIVSLVVLAFYSAVHRDRAC